MMSLQGLKGLNFLNRKQDLIGIDIGTYAIKLVCLRRTASQWALVRWGIIPYADDIPLDTPLVDPRSQAVRPRQNYLRTSDFPTKRAASSVSGNSVIVRYVKMAPSSPSELAKSIKFEAEPYI